MKKFFILLALGVFISTGCVVRLGTGNNSVNKAGVFKSEDGGTTWKEKNLFQYSGGAGNIAGVNVRRIVFDPRDPKAVYITTEASGLFYSYDSGESWRKADQVGNGLIEAVAIDGINNCTVYATYANTILKTTNCSRTWIEAYIDTRADKAVTALATDPKNSSVVYGGNVSGDILKSVDAGLTWQVIFRTKSPITKILLNPTNSSIVYAATKTQGIFTSNDGGGSWNNNVDGLKPYTGGLEYRNVILDPTRPDGIIWVAKYGILRSGDGGLNWEALTLLTPPATTEIYSVAVDPRDGNVLYYSTATTFYKTVDGGQNWVTRRLPTTAIATALVVDPLNSSEVYMGLSYPKK